MKVKTLSTVKYNDTLYEAGQEFEVDEATAKTLIEAGAVEEVVGQAASESASAPAESELISSKPEVQVEEESVPVEDSEEI